MFSGRCHALETTTCHSGEEAKAPLGSASKVRPRDSTSSLSTGWPKACARAARASSTSNRHRSETLPQDPTIVEGKEWVVTPTPNSEASDAETVESHSPASSDTNKGSRARAH